MHSRAEKSLVDIDARFPRQIFVPADHHKDGEVRPFGVQTALTRIQHLLHHAVHKRLRS